MADLDVLIVAGGGGGGIGSTAAPGGGGGAGGVLVVGLPAVPSRTITIGAGGTADTGAMPGANSSVDENTAIGGGWGGHYYTAGGVGGPGGSGAGGVYSSAGGAGTAGQGFAGGQGSTLDPARGSGGGGGAGGVGGISTGNYGGAGGIGISNDFSGVATFYGGGGGGSGWTFPPGAGGSGGGGAGGQGTAGVAGTANTGGGGGGGASGLFGGRGGSGVVIARYLTADFTGTGGTITTAGPYTVHTFTASGTLTMVAKPRGLEAASSFRIASAAALTTGIYLHAAAAAITFASSASLSTAPASFASSSSFSIASSGALTTGARFVSSATTIRFSSTATLGSVAPPEPSPYRDLILAADPIAYWRHGEKTGTTSTDIVGGHHGTIAGGVTLGVPGSVGDVNTAFRFDGISGNISVPAFPFVAPCTAEMWFKAPPGTANENGYFGLFTWPWGTAAAPDDTISFRIIGRRLAYFWIKADGNSNGHVVGATPDVDNDQWHYLATVLRGSDALIYFDGVLVETAPITWAGAINHPIDIGWYPASPLYFKGSLDEVALYDRALSATEVRDHFYAGVGMRTEGPAAIRFSSAGDLKTFLETLSDITIDGVDVKGRIRIAGLTIHDILNDAPNTCSFVMEGDGPAVGQSIRISLERGERVLFAGLVQTVDQSFEGKTTQVAWRVTAIDDTAAANARRPFGVWVDTSATVVAQELATAFAPGFALDGIAPDLPPVSFVFDGSDTMIAALVKLANAIGGYAKIEDGTIYLFLTDPAAAPNPIDESHRFLYAPAIAATVDASQLRTRVYGKGYGEQIRSDLAPGETLIPIQDGAMFPEFGGLAVAATTPNAKQSEHLAYTGRELAGGGTLVGPGAGPTAAPLLAVQPGTGVDNGRHDVAVVFVTATGKSLPGPFASIDVPYFPPPTIAPIAATAINGTGPDQGSHEYAVSLTTAYGETVLGPISNAIPTSAAVGQISPPSSGPYAGDVLAGSGVPDGIHGYGITFITANGETQMGPGSYNALAAGPRLVGQLPPPSSSPTLTASKGEGVEAGRRFYRVTFGDANGDTAIGDSPETYIDVGNGPQLPTPSGYMTATRTAGGSISLGDSYWWSVSFGDAVGESMTSAASNGGTGLAMASGQQSAVLTNIPIGPAGTSKRYIYRYSASSPQAHLVATINDNTTTSITEGLANASVGRLHPGGNTSGEPYHVVNLTNIPIGAAGTTNRKVWRSDPGVGQYRYVNTVSGNLTTILTDAAPTSALGAVAPTTNTTGSTVAYNQVQVISIQTGPAGTTARKLYRQNGLSGPYGFIATINDNTTTQYLDTKGSIGATAPTSNTTGTAVQRIPVSSIPIGPPGTVSRNLYRRFNGAGSFRLVTTIANNTATTFSDTVANAALGAAALATPTAVGNQISVTAIPIGVPAVLSRELYMSPVGTPIRRLALVIGNNTATAAILTNSDAMLGAAAIEPSADLSGLQQPQGQVNPGSTVLPVAAAATFRTSGGWVVLGGNQVVRYTGITAQTLTGIPAEGAGAITTTVLYGSQAMPAPMLVGVTGILVPILRGAAVHIWVQRDDLLAQEEQRARAGGDGVIEFLIVDTARDQPGIMARCDADLAMFSRPLVTVAYATRDLNTRSGKQIPITLTSPRIAEVLTIQDVTITEIDLVHGLAPRFSVHASSVRFSLEDTLRRLIARGPITGGE